MLTLSYTGKYWIKYGDTNEGNLWSVAHYDKNNIYSCGSYTTTKNAVIRKTNIGGECKWIKELGDDINQTTLYSIDTDSFGNAYVAGTIQYSGSSNIILAKYNSSGTLQWKKNLNSAGYNSSESLKISQSNHIYFCGWTDQSGEGDEDLLLMKLDLSGNIIWQKTLGSIESEYGVWLTLDSNEDIIIVGYNIDDILIIKYNSSGTLQWQRKFGKVKVGNFDIEFVKGVAVDSNNNIYIVGYELYEYTIIRAGSLQTAYSFRGIVAKYNSSGVLQWQKVVTSSSNNPVEFSGVTIDSNDDLYIVGTCTTPVGQSVKFPAYVAKMNSLGNVLWQRGLYRQSDSNVQYALSNRGNGISLDEYGDLCIIGRTSYANNQIFDKEWPLMFKVPSDGSLDGIYGPFRYGSVSLTYSSGSYIDSTLSLTENTSSFTLTDSTLTDSSSSCSYDNLIKISDSRESLTIEYSGRYWITTVSSNTGLLYAVTHYDKNNIYSSGMYDSTKNASIRKTNFSGECQWVRELGDGINTTDSYSIDTDSFGNVYVPVTTYYTPDIDRDFNIVKYNSSGVLQWKKKLNSAGRNSAFALKVTNSNHIYVCGETNQFGEGNEDLLVMKLDLSGNILWQKTLGSIESEFGAALAIDSNENVIVVIMDYDDIITVKYNSSGTLQWQRKFGKVKIETFDREFSDSVVIDSQDNIYIHGYELDEFELPFFGGGTSYNYKPIILKYNSSGTLQWQKTIDAGHAGASLIGKGITIDSNDNLYIVAYGSIYISNGFRRIIYLAKLNASGSVQWQRHLYDYTDTTISFSMRELSIDEYGDLCIVGSRVSIISNSYIYYQLILKLPSDGSLTGTYGPYKYESVSLSYSNSTYPESAAGFIENTSNFTFIDSTLIDSPSSCSSDRIKITDNREKLTFEIL